MSFLQPLALLGLFATAIPPLLHLISRRVPPLIPFPALRYLTETERRQSRRLKLRNLLLLILRMLIIAAIVLAAARPIANLALGTSHAPTALALVIDNSLSSGAIVDGRSVLERLVDRARHVLDRADSGDRLWLVVADGVPRRVTIPEANDLLDTLAAWPVRFALSDGVMAAQRAMADDPAPGHEVVVLSDLQMTALSSAGVPDTAGRVLVWEAPGVLPDNRGIDSVWAEPPVWSPQGRVLSVIGGTSQTPTAIRMTLAGQDVARSFGGPGDRVVLTGVSPREGWHAALVSLDPDELRADDQRGMALFVARPASARATEQAGSFVTEGLRVLEEAGRIRPGGEVVLSDRPAPGKVVIFPPADPALVGAVNRDLEGRGVPWQFGELLQGEWTIPEQLEIVAGTAVTQRHRLVGSGSVIARLGGEPWIVRDGDLIIVASRLDEQWSALPVTAGFIPFLDLLINRIAAREVWIETVEPGGAITLPPTVQAILTDAGPLRVDAAREISAPTRPGVYFLQGSSRDTVGALEVNHDLRESRLEQAPAPMIRATLGSGTMVLDDGGLDRELFRGARRADLTGPLLLLALLLAVAEIVLATVGGGRARTQPEADR